MAHDLTSLDLDIDRDDDDGRAMARAALARVGGLISASAIACALSFFILTAMMLIAAFALALGGLAINWTTRAVDEESASAHRKLQWTYTPILVVLAVFSGQVFF